MVIGTAAIGLVGGVLLTAYGLSQLDPGTAIKWTPAGGARALVFAVALAALLFLISRRTASRLVPTALMLFACLMILGGALAALLGVVGFGVASALVGRRLRALWGDAVPLTTDLVNSLLVGAGAYGSLIGVLAHWPINTAGLYVILVLVPLVIDWRGTVALARHAWARASSAGTPETRAVAIVGLCLLLFYAVIALLPELGWDALALHLLIPVATLDQLQWHYDVTRHSFAVTPALGDWLFTIAYAIGGETAARMLLTSAVAVLAFLTADLASRAGATFPWDWLAGTLVLATPVVFTVGASLFIDAVWAALLVGGLAILLFPLAEPRSNRRLVTGAVLVGFSAATKAVTLPLVPLILLAVLARHRPLRQAPLLLAATMGLLASIKPYATAWILTGNPVFPFFNDLFGSPYFPLGEATFGDRFVRGLRWDDLYSITFHSSRHIEGRAGSAGFQWLLLLPAATAIILLRRLATARWLLLIGVVMVAITFHFQSYLRYVIPAFALGTAAIAAAGSAVGQLSVAARRIALGSFVACVALNIVFLNAAAGYETFPLAAAFGDGKARHSLILDAAPNRIAAATAAELSQRSGRVAFLGPPAFSDTHMDALHASWYSPAFYMDLLAAKSVGGMAQALAEWDVRYFVLHRHWGTPPQREYVEQASSYVGLIGAVEVRKVRSELGLTKELLANPDFASIEGWVIAAPTKHDSARQGVVVSANSPAYQPVPVTGRSVYLLSLEARCVDRIAEGRLQVIWLTDDRAPGVPDVKTFMCTSDLQTHVRELIAPAEAKTAVVYATGHAADELFIKRVSFKAKSVAGSPR